MLLFENLPAMFIPSPIISHRFSDQKQSEEFGIHSPNLRPGAHGEVASESTHHVDGHHQVHLLSPLGAQLGTEHRGEWWRVVSWASPYFMEMAGGNGKEAIGRHNCGTVVSWSLYCT